MTNKNGNALSELVSAILKGMEDKKAEDICHLDLQNIEHAVCDGFVICSGNSDTQVEAIAKSVQDSVQKSLGEKPWHVEGMANKSWVLIDFVNIVVHVFLPEDRAFYGLESLWADARITRFEPSA